MRKSAMLDGILGGAIGYLESCPGVSEVKLCTRSAATAAALREWESRQSMHLAVASAATIAVGASAGMGAGSSLSSHLVAPNIRLPEDLRGLYSITDGLTVQWSAKFAPGDEPIVVGCIHINSLDRLARVDGPSSTAVSLQSTLSGGLKVGGATLGGGPEIEQDISPEPCGGGASIPQGSGRWKGAQVGCMPTSLKGVPGPPGPAYLLHESRGYGRVCLCYPLTTTAASTSAPTSATAEFAPEPNSKPIHSTTFASAAGTADPYTQAQPQVWLQDTRGVWYPLARSFSSYFRLAVAHLGIIGWQLGMADAGMPRATADWLTFYSPERAAVDRRVRAALRAAERGDAAFGGRVGGVGGMAAPSMPARRIGQMAWDGGRRPDGVNGEGAGGGRRPTSGETGRSADSLPPRGASRPTSSSSSSSSSSAASSVASSGVAIGGSTAGLGAGVGPGAKSGRPGSSATGASSVGESAASQKAEGSRGASKSGSSHYVVTNSTGSKSAGAVWDLDKTLAIIKASTAGAGAGAAAVAPATTKKSTPSAKTSGAGGLLPGAGAAAAPAWERRVGSAASVRRQ
ncbi:hypothetical protein DFJ73DRAFT_773242 [Zopfochytrium polystomum]|nr:hypothetical protein DFJ73DRAFT_773242 [Zopfochytrium polystomum]